MGLCCIYSCDYFIHLAVFLKVIHVDKEAVIANDQVLCVVAVGTFHFMNIMQCIQLPVLARKGIFFGQDFCNFKQYHCCGHSCTFLLVHITSSRRVYTEKEDFWVTGNVHLQLH